MLEVTDALLSKGAKVAFTVEYPAGVGGCAVSSDASKIVSSAGLFSFSEGDEIAKGGEVGLSTDMLVRW
jgi:hypothetical protein